MATPRPTPIPHPYHRRTRNNRDQPETIEARNPCYGWISAGFPWSAGIPKWGVLGLITRRSRVQIPPPLLKALVSELLAGASTVCSRLLSGLYVSSTVSTWVFVGPRTFGFLLLAGGGFGRSSGVRSCSTGTVS